MIYVANTCLIIVINIHLYIIIYNECTLDVVDLVTEHSDRKVGYCSRTSHFFEY